ncbi:MAG: 23S rRNA (adenine(2503)-C(2))-methyltransferase RlmN [Candidatus Stygibacter australis]|nr:23S rRNA (adenine(2503)-C(2))-methyltransferase RlmN [Candidatus Stygibacter australis]MDP8321428.1 23S rRNA (adenine(2503)-C(2))-methyltransferase RlmN [Candidatus Stygibacter australis]
MKKTRLMPKTSILSLLPAELEDAISELGEKKYRSKQLMNWIYQQNILDFTKMSNFAKNTIQTFNDHFTTYVPFVDKISHSDDGTRKYLLKLIDDNYIEMVLIPAEDKLTLCISSQAGCKRGCIFCSTSRLGLIRNLSVEEITGQVYLARQLAGESKITNIVFMGMGEPLDNLESVIKAIRILQNDQCFSLSPRRITVSTCGIIPGIKQLSETGLKVKLAVSLNSAIDDKRSEIMPINVKYPLSELKPALQQFTKTSHFRITFEYVLIPGFNMDIKDQKALRKFTGDISSKINLIPWNPIPGLDWNKPSEKEVNNFMNIMYKLSAVPITLRNSRGQDINAACGMLAGKRRESPTS